MKSNVNCCCECHQRAKPLTTSQYLFYFCIITFIYFIFIPLIIADCYCCWLPGKNRTAHESYKRIIATINVINTSQLDVIYNASILIIIYTLGSHHIGLLYNIMYITRRVILFYSFVMFGFRIHNQQFYGYL